MRKDSGSSCGRGLIAAGLLLGELLAGSAAFAHSEMDRPLFVAADGIDRDRCYDPAAPCRSISYALQRVGKGGEIRVATGRYEIRDPADIFSLASGLVDVRGGFDRADGFARPTAAPATLVGVPEAYREMLESRGFHVIADRKAFDTAAIAKTEKMLELHASQQRGLKTAPCSGGRASGLACDGTELLSQVSLAEVSSNPGTAADVWGFVDLNTNREYAIVGYNTGTAVFDVTDPADPREVGFVGGQNTTWRDIKVYQFFDQGADRWQAYAYVTADGARDGLVIIDLSELPQRISRHSYESDFTAAHNVFATHTDYGTGLSLSGAAPTLVIAGSNNGGGRFRSYSLAEPGTPAFVSIPNVESGDYMHDAASIIIRDSRKDTQCVNATDYCEVLFDFNESTVDIWDVTNPASPVRLSRTPYENSAYTHSGWPSEDGRYLFVHDELDEQSFGLRTTLRSLSLADLRSPSFVGTWQGPTTAIDHNGFVRGSRYYMSNYSRGLTILDISDPVAVRTAGFLDTYPFSDGANFVGAWGAYPYFHSGHIAVSDISSGLYLIRDDTLSPPQGQVSFGRRAFGGTEGELIVVTLTRTNGAAGSIGVELDLVPGTADTADVAMPVRAVTWADGDSDDKSITLAASADGVTEGLERMLIRLVAPAGGAALAPSSVASVYVGDPGDAAVLEFARSTVDVGERGFGKAVVTFRRRGSSAGTASVQFALSDSTATAGSDYAGATTGTIEWADGDADPKWIEFEIVDDGSGEADEYFELSLAAPYNAVIGPRAVMRVNIMDSGGENRAPTAHAGPDQTVQPGATVQLDGAASGDPDEDLLSYRWTQIRGPSVVLGNALTARASFTAPAVSSNTLLGFRLEVADPSGSVDTAEVGVTVSASPGNSSSGGGGAFGAPLLLAALLLARRRVIRRDAAGRSSGSGPGPSK